MFAPQQRHTVERVSRVLGADTIINRASAVPAEVPLSATQPLAGLAKPPATHTEPMAPATGTAAADVAKTTPGQAGTTAATWSNTQSTEGKRLWQRRAAVIAVGALVVGGGIAAGVFVSMKDKGAVGPAATGAVMTTNVRPEPEPPARATETAPPKETAPAIPARTTEPPVPSATASASPSATATAVFKTGPKPPAVVTTKAPEGPTKPPATQTQATSPPATTAPPNPLNVPMKN